MDYKLLILDLDGTTVKPGRDALPSPKVIEAVKKAQAKLHVAVATGRPLPETQPVINALKLKGLGVVNGGAEIIDMETGEVVYSKKIQIENLRELIKLCLPFGYSMYTSDDQYGFPISSAESVFNDTEKLFIEAVKAQDAIRILEELEAIQGATAHPTKSWTPGDVVDIHVTHEHATKRYGVERLIEIMNLQKEQVIAIGDDHNDVPLMMAAGTKVAMGDAPKQVKDIADYVTETLEEDGVASAIDKFIAG